MTDVRDNGMVDGSVNSCNDFAARRAPVRCARSMPHVYQPATGRR
jgi:hypothetical protein